MRKASLILLMGAVLVLSMLIQVRSVHAVSCGYERHVSDDFEVYLEYLPIFPVDSNNPSASEEWAFKFYIKQKNIGRPIVVPSCASFFPYIPGGWNIDVYFRDDTTVSNNWTTWKRWYPLSMSDNHLPVSWSLSAGYGPLTIGTTITVPNSNTFDPNYTKFPAYLDDGKIYMRVGYLKVGYASTMLWDGATCEGAGSLGIPNDLAAQHLGHHIRIYFRFTVRWWCPWPPIKEYPVTFIVGDDYPAATDCFITAQQGTTSFSTGGCPPIPPIYGSRIHTTPGGSRTCMPK